MITQPQPLPAHLVNRDLKRELRYIPPGYSQTVHGVPVKRLTGKQSQMYSIYGFKMDVDCVADVLTGYTPMPAKPVKRVAKARKQKPLQMPLTGFGFQMAVAA